MYLSRAETETIDAAIARVEGRTGVQVVTAIVSKADAYAELPWMAFALGVSLAALVSVLVDRVRPDWITAHVALLSTVTVLAAGAASALVARPRSRTKTSWYPVSPPTRFDASDWYAT